MSTKLPAKTEFELAPAGTTLGICTRVLDIGTQLWKSAMYGDEQCPGILIGFELPHELMRDDRPFSISQRFKLKSGKNAKYRKFLEAWRGTPFTDADYGTFDAKVLLGQPAMLQIVHTVSGDSTYANIETIMRPMKGTAIPQPHNELLHLDLDHFDQAVFDKLSDRLKETISKSPEYAALSGAPQQAAPAPLHDDIPF